MQSLERLTMEHALLGRGLGVLEIVVERYDRGKEVPEDTVRRLLDFFETFGDRYHHIKEEHVLIPKLEDKCESRSHCHSGRTIGQIYYEHEVGRGMLERMQKASERLQDATGRAEFVDLANDYIGFMRSHIVKEKNSLIRSASKMLATEDRALERSFRSYASREGIAETSQEFASEIDAMLAELSITVPPCDRQAYSRGSIPSHAGGMEAQIRF